ncbi:MAG: metallophosphoesterase [candidate division Zixibacteria bacterium]|nr:metallophosphoesterase [candidate division Zixibacteria bacterium]
MVYVIADTHIPKRVSRIPSEFIRKVKGDDVIIHAGDFTELKVYLELERLATLYAVRGNMDCPQIKEVLPSKKIFELSGFKIGLIHGFGTTLDSVQRISEQFREKPDLIIFGHTHSPCNLRKGSTLFFNPGSLSGNIPLTMGSYGILNLEQGNIRGEIVFLR